MTIKRLIPVAPIVAAMVLIMSMAASDTAYAQATFNPTLEVMPEDPTPEALSGNTLVFALPEGDVNFAGVVGFIPPDVGIVHGNYIPTGAVVGELSADTVLGLANSPCNQELLVEFKMLNSSLDTGDTIDFDAEEGGIDPETEDWAEDLDENGLLEHVDKWPEFIERVLEDTDVGSTIRRSSAMTIVASTPVLLQFLIFPPGTFIDENIPNAPELGYPSVTLLQNAGDPEIEPEPGVITDFCSPLTSTNISFGITQDNDDTPDVDESGYPLFVNPQDGTYTFTVASVGQRDADGDGFENSLDTCPLTANVGNPRVPNIGDEDGDGLDAACDPDDTAVNADEDLDGYQNRQDNCPLFVNGEQSTNQVDEDEDQIGDDCDPNPDSSDTEGELLLAESSVDLSFGDGTGAGGPPDCQAAFAASTGLSPDVPDDLDCVAAGDQPQPTDGPDGTPGPDDDDDDDGGTSTGLIIGIVVGIIAAVAIIGGGAALMMRRGGGA